VKPSTVRGTPVRSISQGGYDNTGKPSGFQGTVNGQYAGQSATPGGGTPYHSGAGNDDQAKRVASRGTKMGTVIDTQTGTNMNEPESNGNGVVFDGVSRSAGYRAGSQPQTLDSPVPTDCQKPVQDAPVKLANIRSGIGGSWGPDDGPGDNFQTMGGVMDR